MIIIKVIKSVICDAITNFFMLNCLTKIYIYVNILFFSKILRSFHFYVAQLILQACYAPYIPHSVMNEIWLFL